MTEKAYSVLMLYPSWLAAHDAPPTYFANRIVADDIKSAVAAAQKEAIKALSPRDRRGVKMAHFLPLLVLNSHHDAADHLLSWPRRGEVA
jgi:hypothetical protein